VDPWAPGLRDEAGASPDGIFSRRGKRVKQRLDQFFISDNPGNPHNPHNRHPTVPAPDIRQTAMWWQGSPNRGA